MMSNGIKFGLCVVLGLLVAGLVACSDADAPATTSVADASVGKIRAAGSLGAPVPGGGAGAPPEDEGSAEEPEGEESAEGVEADEPIGDDLLAGEMPTELTNEEKIENFRSLDPRDIILAKYDDLAERKTIPWDEEDPQNFIPQTGRYDPLTPVLDEIPDELKPDRGGETDQNEIDTYLIAQECTLAVRQLGAAISVHNVIQIGSDKMATISIAGSRAAVREGQGFDFPVSQYGNVPIVAGFNVSSISADQVVVSIYASGQGTTTSVSHTKVFIPKN